MAARGVWLCERMGGVVHRQMHTMKEQKKASVEICRTRPLQLCKGKGNGKGRGMVYNWTGPQPLTSLRRGGRATYWSARC